MSVVTNRPVVDMIHTLGHQLIIVWIQPMSPRRAPAPARSEPLVDGCAVARLLGIGLFLLSEVVGVAASADAQETRHPVPELIARPFEPTSSVDLDAEPHREGFPHLSRRLEGEERSVTIGMLEGPRHRMFGKVQDVGLASDGRVVVLDARYNEVRVYRRDGTFVDAAGGPGRGPGEFIAPLSLAVGPSGRIYAGDLGRSIHVFELEGDSLRYAETYSLPIAPKDLCRLENILVVHGASLEVQELLHVLDLDGEHLRSFGAVYESNNPAVRQRLSQGEIACLPAEESVLYAPGGVIAEIRAYTKRGDVRWITKVDGYRPVGFVELAGGGWRVTIPRAGFHRMGGLVPAPAGEVVLQVAFVTRENTDSGVASAYERMFTFALDGATGEGALIDDALPLIGALDAETVVSVLPGPVPEITISSSADDGIEDRGWR